MIQNDQWWSMDFNLLRFCHHLHHSTQTGWELLSNGVLPVSHCTLRLVHMLHLKAKAALWQRAPSRWDRMSRSGSWKDEKKLPQFNRCGPGLWKKSPKSLLPFWSADPFLVPARPISPSAIFGNFGVLVSCSGSHDLTRQPSAERTLIASPKLWPVNCIDLYGLRAVFKVRSWHLSTSRGNQEIRYPHS